LQNQGNQFELFFIEFSSVEVKLLRKKNVSGKKVAMSQIRVEWYDNFRPNDHLPQINPFKTGDDYSDPWPLLQTYYNHQ